MTSSATSEAEHRVAVVTGAGHGIGRASVRRFLADGYRVVAVDRDLDGAQETVSSAAGSAIAVRADIRSEADIAAYVDAGLHAFGRIDVHHLNAGIISSLAPLTAVPLREFDDVMAVNVRGTFMGMQHAIRQLESQGSGGAVVITSSIHGARAATDAVAYQISKSALNGLVRAAAMYGAPLGIRVNAVAPGLVQTADDEDVRRDVVGRSRTVPARRPGTEDEIAATVAFLAGDGAAYIHGHILTVDGGASIVNTVRPSGGAGAWEP